MERIKNIQNRDIQWAKRFEPDFRNAKDENLYLESVENCEGIYYVLNDIDNFYPKKQRLPLIKQFIKRTKYIAKYFELKRNHWAKIYILNMLSDCSRVDKRKW